MLTTGSSNMLYPKDDRVTNTLMFACRTCTFTEQAASACVFQNRLNNSVGETAGVTQDVGSDPTVCLSDFCTMCGDEIKCFVCGNAQHEAGDHSTESEGSSNEGEEGGCLSC